MDFVRLRSKMNNFVVVSRGGRVPVPHSWRSQWIGKRIKRENVSLSQIRQQWYNRWFVKIGHLAYLLPARN